MMIGVFLPANKMINASNEETAIMRAIDKLPLSGNDPTPAETIPPMPICIKPR